MGSPLLARKNQLLNPIKRSRSSTPGGFGKLSTRSGRSELRTPSLRADIKRQEHNSHQLKLGQQMVDERLHLQSDNWQDKYGDLDGKIDIADVTLQKERCGVRYPGQALMVDGAGKRISRGGKVCSS